MSSPETLLSPYGSVGESLACVPQPNASTSTERTLLLIKILEYYFRPMCQGLRKGYPDRIITEFGNAVERRKNVPHIEGLKEFSDTIEKIRDSNEHPHILVVANHPDFLRTRLQSPLWFMSVPYTMGKILGRDPYVFVNGDFVPEIVARNTRLLRVMASENSVILKMSSEAMLDERPNGFFILPEGTTAKDDCMMKARSGGTLRPMEAAVKNDRNLVVLPVAFIQRSARRGDKVLIPGHDEYIVRTGDHVSAKDLLPAGYKFDIHDINEGREQRGPVIDGIMTDIAEMMPPEKRGYYARRVDERERKRLKNQSPAEPLVLFQGIQGRIIN